MPLTQAVSDLLGEVQKRFAGRFDEPYMENMIRLTTCYWSSWSIPTEGSLLVLERLACEHAGIVEIGAGIGFLARLLREMGVDVVAYDKNPIPHEKRPSHAGYPNWTDILSGDQTVAGKHADRVLLLSWPCFSSPMASESLQSYQDNGGDTLVFIGQRDGKDGACGDPQFWQMLDAGWELKQVVNLPRWSGRRDDMRVYTRK